MNNTENQLQTIFKADYPCKFELFHRDDTDCQGESNLVFGYCVIDAQGIKHHYVAIEQGTDYDNPLTVYPPCPIVGSTVFICSGGSMVECWSLEQFNLASSSWCATIYPLFDN